MKAPLILLHGALGAASQFETWKPRLEPHFQVYSFDFEGHGTQPLAERPYRIEHFAENLASFIRDNELNAPAIFGYSMGGYVALYLEKSQPGLCGPIFTFASKLHWDPETAAKEVRMLDPDKILAKVPRFAQALEARHAAPGWREVLTRTADMMLHLGNHPALSVEDYQKIQQKVRIGIGDRDNMVSLEESVNAYQNLENGAFQVFPETPHPIEKIDPERVCNAIVDFF